MGGQRAHGGLPVPPLGKPCTFLASQISQPLTPYFEGFAGRYCMKLKCFLNAIIALSIERSQYGT